ncbi:T-cell surface glycoprotein CD4 [Gracilinanus agilis]|uniref:T-cell surface glycoprotein CD4 n=1 Tax=Gracilinanus agilis TaxID=191870 RepID=UPI001CFC906C|nr:T-cell surface glycoprotein CD4 [Gracilinanus agilis]
MKASPRPGVCATRRDLQHVSRQAGRAVLLPGSWASSRTLDSCPVPGDGDGAMNTPRDSAPALGKAGGCQECLHNRDEPSCRRFSPRESGRLLIRLWLLQEAIMEATRYRAHKQRHPRGQEINPTRPCAVTTQLGDPPPPPVPPPLLSICLSVSLVRPSNMKERVDSSINQWDVGSFPLTIKNLETSDSGIYFCEVEDRKQQVQLLVFKVTANPSESVLSGNNVTLTLHSPPNLSELKVEWHGPGDKSKRILSSNRKTLNLLQVDPTEGGDWDCTVSINGKSLKLSKKVTVHGFECLSKHYYTISGKDAEFTFPLNLKEQELARMQPNGELTWQVKGAARSAKFSWKDDSLTLDSKFKFKLTKRHPITLSLSPVLPQHAGSGVFSLMLSSGTLKQKVDLVVMTAVSQDSSPQQLFCDVLGPIISGLTLKWLLENQTKEILEVSEEQRQLEVKKPKPGMWECQLLLNGTELLKSNSFQLAAELEWYHPLYLGIGLGAGASLLLLSGFITCCCARRRHRLRQAERMSQIRRLLSEKKTCQCPH